MAQNYKKPKVEMHAKDSDKENPEPDFEGAKKRLSKFVVNWFIDDPILLNTYCMVDKVADSKQDTIGIDIRCNPPALKYNPNFINTISDQQLEYVLTSENFKILLRHCTTRLLSPHNLSALSSSITTNYLLKKNQNFREMDEDFVLLPKDFGLEDNKYFEEYFRKLSEMQDKANQMMEQIWNSMSKEQKEQMMNGGGQGQGKGEPQQQQGQGDKQDQKEQQDNKDNNGYTQFKNQEEAFKEYFNPNGTTSQGWGKNEMFDADVKQMIDDKKDSAKHWGKYTGEIMAEIIAANEARIGWKDVVKRFNQSVMDSRSISSRMKVNRRYDLLYPGYKRKYKTKVIFAVDVSGSMSDDDLKECFSVINMICKHADLEFIQFDTQIKSIEKKVKKARQSFKVTGRGGTDFNAILEYADKTNTDGVIIATDGQAEAPKQPNCKVLWLMSTKEQNPPVQWGFKAHLNRYESH
jgi:hypothetical protein